MEQRTDTRDQMYFDRLDKIIEAMDKTNHRLKEINGTLGRIHFHLSDGDIPEAEMIEAVEKLKGIKHDT